MTALFSKEGISGIGSRYIGASFFQLSDLKDAWRAYPETTSPFTLGKAFGKWFGSITNYQI